MTGNERDGMLSLKGIKIRRCVPALVALLTCSLAASAADPKVVYDEATNALYNLDFNTAERAYESLTRDYPDNPDYWNALASSIWLRVMYGQSKLNMESFSGSS